jgi:hypothetical protein
VAYNKWTATCPLLGQIDYDGRWIDVCIDVYSKMKITHLSEPYPGSSGCGDMTHRLLFDLPSIRKICIEMYVSIFAVIEKSSYNYLSACIQLGCACSPWVYTWERVHTIPGLGQ